MIIVSRLNDTKIYLNPHQIEMIEETPDCVITLVTGKKIILKDKAEEIVKKIIEYRQKIYRIDDTNILIREHQS